MVQPSKHLMIISNIYDLLVSGKGISNVPSLSKKNK
jgi:hypothetical protein